MMVRDEDDVIEKNIRFHSAMGVEKFFVVNNASTDDTGDILSELSKVFDITVIYEPDETGYMQKEWMTKLIGYARKNGCDWIINNDADEFWLPDNGTDLRKVLNRHDGTVVVNRENVQNYEGISSIFESIYIGSTPIGYDSRTTYGDKYLNLNLNGCAHKVITNVHGLIKIRGGNHAAKHIIDKLHRRRFTHKTKRIENFHYPIRTYKQFVKRLDIIKKIGDAGRMRQMGQNARYWYEASCQGKVDEAYEQFILKKADLATLEKYDVICKDERMYNAFKKLRLI